MKTVIKFLSCTAIAIGSFYMTGCADMGKKTAIGAGAGAAVGAGLGAIIGHQSGKRGEGAAIGAAVGGLLGGGAGAYLDKQAAELARIAETKRTEQGIVTKLKSDITFSSGSANVKAQQNIQQIAQIIAKYPEDIVKVVGHTDSTGSDAFNQSLSQQRAQNVMQIMTANGVPAGSITAIGMGENAPIADNNSSTGRQQNRRVEIQITVDESKIQKK